MTDHKYGPKGHIVDAFIVHIRGMTAADWDKVAAAWDAAWDPARPAAGVAAWDTAWDAAWDAAREPEWGAAWAAAWDAARYAAWGAAHYGGRSAAEYAAWEIKGADIMRKRGYPFYFLPMFGFADEHAVLAALQPKEGNQ